MADAAASKAAKKNAKRKAAKKKKEGGAGQDKQGLDPENMLDILKKQLETAKLEKNHDEAGKLRDQIWVLTDLVNGVRTDIPDSDLLPILLSIEEANKQINGPDTSETTSAASGQAASTNLTPEEKKIRTLKKKLQQIDSLRERQRKGEKLEETQVAKLQSEDQIKEEIEELEELIENVLSLKH